MTIVGAGLAPARYYYIYDGLGSVSEILDSTGAVIEKYTYDIYGKVTIRNTHYGKWVSVPNYLII